MEEKKEKKRYEPYKHETAEQREAFEYYYSLGTSRNLEKVAEKYGRSVRTMYEWSRKFNWQERIQQYDIEVSKKLKEKTVNAVADEKANYRKIIKLAIADFVNRLRGGEIKVTNIYEFRELVKLDLMLLGESTEIIENKNSHTVSLTEEDRKLLEDLAKGFQAELKNLEE